MEATDIKNIHQRMLAVMTDIAYVQKEDKKVNDQYRFVSHDAVTAKVRGALIKHGIVATTDIVRHEQNGNRTEVDVRVEFINVDNPADRVAINAFGYGIDSQDKGPGKAVSYAVKYAYLKAFALETGDDPERDNINHEPGKKPANAVEERIMNGKPITATQHAKDALEAMPAEQQQFLREQAIEIIALHESQGNLHEHVERQHYDTEEKLALWSLLPSNVRSTYKKQQAQARLGSQA